MACNYGDFHILRVKIVNRKKTKIVAASRVQRFWMDGKNRLKWKKTAKGLKNRQSETVQWA
jgi:hypothetical protein